MFSEIKIVICGSRSITDINILNEAINSSGFEFDTVISGGARGVDTLAIQWANTNNKKLEIYPAEWNRYGIKAGYIRNKLMGDTGDGIIAIWDGISPGTKNMIDIARAKNLKFIYVHKI